MNQTSFRGISERHREANYETVVLNGLYFPAVDFLASVATAIVLGYGGWLVLEGDMTVGTLLAFTLYLSNFFDPVQQLAALQHVPLGDRSTRPHRRRARREGRRRGRTRRRRSTASTAMWCSRECGSDTARGLEVLHGIDLDVPAGTTVALVGHTGAEVDDAASSPASTTC